MQELKNDYEKGYHEGLQAGERSGIRKIWGSILELTIDKKGKEEELSVLDLIDYLKETYNLGG